MFLTSPSISELKMLDLPTLVEMLVHQTTEYVEMMKEEGLTEKTVAANELLSNIQTAIISKQQAEKALMHEGSTMVASQNGSVTQTIRKIH